MIIGRYALYDAIAAGGMASVHLGQLLGPAGFARVVAIKRLHEGFGRDPEFVSAFLDEARLAARVRHPNVVPTLDVVAAKGELFVVMEYVHGVSLAVLIRGLLDRGQRMPPPIAASILSGALQGLHAAHEATNEQGHSLDIVHRDVSPQNIIVGADGTARVLDFGVAKAIGMGQTTREGSVKGKIPYMSPEQIRGGRLTRQSDIYAASVVLWETLTCKRLFKAETDTATFACVMMGAVSKPSEQDLTLAPFDQVVMKGLSRRPKDRFATAREMALAVERCAGVSSSAEVAEWLEQTVGATLSQRAEAIAAVESSSGSGDRPSPLVDVGAVARSGEGSLFAALTSGADGPSPAVGHDVIGDSTDIGEVIAHASASSPPRRPISGAAVRAGSALAAVLAGVALLIATARGRRVEPPAASSPTPVSERRGAVTAEAPTPATDPEQAAVSAPSAEESAPPLSTADAAPPPNGRATVRVTAAKKVGVNHLRAPARAPGTARAGGTSSARHADPSSPAASSRFHEIGGRQ